MLYNRLFFILYFVSYRYLEDYFISGLEVLQNDAGILEGLLKKTCPPVYRHLQKHRVEPLLYMTDWFLCAMTRTLPWETLLRVWDCFLAEGIRVIFKVALVVLGASLNSHKVRKQCNGLCETLEVLRNPPDNVLDEDFIINHMQRLNLRVEDFQIEHTRQKARRAKQKALQEAAAAATAASSSSVSAATAMTTVLAPTTAVNSASSTITTTAQSSNSTSNSQNNTFTRSRTTSPTNNITSGSVTVVNIGGEDESPATTYDYTSSNGATSNGGTGAGGVVGIGGTAVVGGGVIGNSNGSVSITTNNYHT